MSHTIFMRTGTIALLLSQADQKDKDKKEHRTTALMQKC